MNQAIIRIKDQEILSYKRLDLRTSYSAQIPIIMYLHPLSTCLGQEGEIVHRSLKLEGRIAHKFQCWEAKIRPHNSTT